MFLTFTFFFELLFNELNIAQIDEVLAKFGFNLNLRVNEFE